MLLAADLTTPDRYPAIWAHAEVDPYNFRKNVAVSTKMVIIRG